MSTRPDPEYYDLTLSQEEEKELKQQGDMKACRYCLKPMPEATRLATNRHMHRECALADARERRVKRENTEEIPSIDVSTLKSPFDVLDLIGKFE